VSIGDEYLTSNSAIAYPFQEDARGLARMDDAAHGSPAKLPSDVFVDGLLMLPADELSVIYLTSLTKTGTSLAFQFSNADGDSVLAATVDTAAWDLTATYQLMTVAEDDAFARLTVLTSAFVSYFSALTADSFVETIPMEHGVVNNRTLRIETLKLLTTLPDPPEPDVPGDITGDVTLIAGYNTRLILNSEIVGESSDTTVMGIDFIPGDGEGRVPCEEEVTTIVHHPFNGEIIPDGQGNVMLETDGCYGIVPTVAGGLFRLEGVCAACCSCDDYNAVLKTLEGLFARAGGVDYPDGSALSQLNDAAAKYTTGVESYNTYIAPSLTEPKWLVNAVKGMPLSDVIRRGASNYVTIVCELRNLGADDLDPVSVELALTSPDPDDTTVFTLTWQYDGAGGTGDPTVGPAAAMPLTTPPTIPTHGVFKAFMYASFDYAIDSNPTWAGTCIIKFADGSTLSDAFEVS